jgi:hypothetical protein
LGLRFSIGAVMFDSKQIRGLTSLSMTRRHPTLASLLLVLPLLLLPLQGHARMAPADAAMPCATGQYGMHDTEAVSAGQADHQLCDAGSPCGTECQNCAGCSHIQAGIAIMLQAPPPRQVPAGYLLSAGQAYTSITLFTDHPPPRIG